MAPSNYVQVTIAVPGKPDPERAVLRDRWLVRQHPDGFGVEHQTMGEVIDVHDMRPVRWKTREAAEAWVEEGVDRVLSNPEPWYLGGLRQEFR